MKISICIHCMNRLDDLRQIMPHLYAAADSCPPVEIVIVDYNSSDGLGAYVDEIVRERDITYRRYEGREYFHLAHARNLSALAAHGDCLVLTGADIIISPEYMQAVREAVEGGAVFVHQSSRFVGVLCVRRDEFIAAGGYDERFEGYGKEDKDLLARLLRRGRPHAEIPTLLDLIVTPWSKKLANYDPALGGRNQMRKRSKPLYQGNVEAGILVANEGKEWGSWD